MKKKAIRTTVKQMVRVRFRNLADGSKSIYLDTYVGGKRWYEFLHMYLVKERTKEDRLANERTLSAVDSIRAERQRELAYGRKVEHAEGGGMTLHDYLESYCAEQERRGNRGILGIRHVCKLVSSQFGNLRMKELSPDLYFRFDSFLHTGYKTDRRCHAGQIAQSSRRLYLSILNAALNAAVRKSIIMQNPFNKIAPCDRVRPTENTRQYLTTDELRRLIDTPMPRRRQCEVKRAYLFSCFCGLRLSDVRALRWEQMSSCDGRTTLEIKMKKTGHRLSLPISDAAKRWIMPDHEHPSTGQVFRLPELHTIENNLRCWSEAAGINKYLTFHTSRHTFATMMMTLGADLYTTSKLLGHTSVRTTQIYARIIDKKKEEAVDLANKLFLNSSHEQ